MSARSLEAALRAHGIDCAVEAHEALAVLALEPCGIDLRGAETRELVLRLGREHGFTHVALEIEPPHASTGA